MQLQENFIICKQNQYFNWILSKLITLIIIRIEIIELNLFITIQ